MAFIRRNGFLFLLLGVLSDFLMPYILAFFYPELNPVRSVISLYGEVKSPVRQVFLIWSVLTGLFYLLSLSGIYAQIKETSTSYAKLVTLLIAAYGLGEGILSGVFSLDKQLPTWDFSAWMHNLGSAVGFASFMFLPYVLYRYYGYKKDSKNERLYFWLMLMNFLLIGFYFVSRMITILHFLPFQADGFFQRLSYFFTYLPIGLFAVKHLKQQKTDLAIK